MANDIPDYCYMRTGDEAPDDEFIDLECRFPSGEKYAAIRVCGTKQALAEFIMEAIRTRYSH